MDAGDLDGSATDLQEVSERAGEEISDAKQHNNN